MTGQAASQPSARWLGRTIAVTAALGVGWRGGYPDDARGVLAALAGVALLLAIAHAPGTTARAAREPIVLVLGALAALTALSAAWTIGSSGAAFRDAAVVLAFAAIVIAAAAMPGRPYVHAAILFTAALGVALIGLLATLSASQPEALNICGAWRPAGTLEYPPALALVCAGALPLALRAMLVRWTPGRLAGALAAWTLALTIALTGNRTGIALGGLALVISVALAPSRRVAVAACGSGIIAIAAASAFALGADPAAAPTARLVLAAAPALLLVGFARSARYTRIPQSGRWPALALAMMLGLIVGALAIDRAGACGGDLSHGRTGIWNAALHTAEQRPLQGYGADTFLAASRTRQLRERPVPTRFAHDLPLEAWVELGAGGLVLVLAWYLITVRTVLRARGETAWLLAPAMIAFPLSNLLDWPWHLAGTGVLWAVAAGGLLGARLDPPAPPTARATEPGEGSAAPRPGSTPP